TIVLLFCLSALACAGAGSVRPSTTLGARSVPAMGNPTTDLAQARAFERQLDQRSPDALAATYLQRIRDSGDPTYYGKAEALLASALHQDPNDLEALIQMGSLTLGRHQFREALSWGNRAHYLSPDSARALGVVGDAQIELGRYPEAVETIQKMDEQNADLSSYARD